MSQNSFLNSILQDQYNKILSINSNAFSLQVTSTQVVKKISLKNDKHNVCALLTILINHIGNVLDFNVIWIQKLICKEIYNAYDGLNECIIKSMLVLTLAH